jgi:hypothetical protein
MYITVYISESAITFLENAHGWMTWGKIPHCRNNSKIKYQNHRNMQKRYSNTQIYNRSLSRLDTGTSTVWQRSGAQCCGWLSLLFEVWQRSGARCCGWLSLLFEGDKALKSNEGRGHLWHRHSVLFDQVMMENEKLLKW